MRSFFAASGAARILIAFVSVAVCATFARAEPGVTKHSIVLGQSGPMSGPAAELGIEFRIGAQLVFDKANASGGINGRDIDLRTSDDVNDPARMEQNIVSMVTNEPVFALFGVIGTPTPGAMRAIGEQRVPLFATYSGDAALREPFNRQVFNLRAGYADEIDKLIETLTVIGQKHIAVFYQDDEFGKASLATVEAALAKRKMKIAAKSAAPRDSLALDAAVKTALAPKPDAVIMLNSYGPCAEFVKRARKAGSPAQFYTISHASGKPLARALGTDGAGLGITKVVPSPWNPGVPIVNEYQKAMAQASSQDYSFTSLEGFIAAKVMLEALKRINGEPTRDKLVAALESLRDLDLGGVRVSFSGANHNNAKPFVDVAIIRKDGRFSK
jgi:branched-chain amino acid transport system substrate-binding protein